MNEFFESHFRSSMNLLHKSKCGKLKYREQKPEKLIVHFKRVVRLVNKCYRETGLIDLSPTLKGFTFSMHSTNKKMNAVDVRYDFDIIFHRNLYQLIIQLSKH